MIKYDGQKIRKIGVLAPNKRFFGAHIVIIPFLYNLKRIFPASRITVISPRKESSILNVLGLIDDIVINDITGGTSTFFNIVGEIRKRRFDILFTLRRKSERDWLINLLSGCRLKIGFKRKWSPLVYNYYFKYDKNTYRAANFLKLLKPFDNKPVEYGPVYPGYICRTLPAVWLIPCGVKKKKLWPIDNYIELARKIILELKEKVVFVLGTMEKKYKSYIIEKLQEYSGSIAYLVEEPLRTLLGEVNNCMAAVSNDCGPCHVPQIAGKKTIVLFPGKANVNEWVNREAMSMEIVSEKEWISRIPVKKVFSYLAKEIKE